MNELSLALTKLAQVIGVLSIALAAPASYEIAPRPIEIAAFSPYMATEFTNYAIPKLIQCESGGRSVKHLDVNGYFSYGILQVQSSTWNWWSRESGIKGDPMVPNSAIEMAIWAINSGYLSHWSCAKITGLL